MILFRTRLTPKNYERLKALTRDRELGKPLYTDQGIINEALEDWFKKHGRIGAKLTSEEILERAHLINAGYKEPRGALRKSKRKPAKR